MFSTLKRPLKIYHASKATMVLDVDIGIEQSKSSGRSPPRGSLGCPFSYSTSGGMNHLFGKKKDAAAEPSTPTPAPSPDIAKQKAALLAAKEVGALSEALYSQAMEEVLARAK